jgi:hypothetical protein
MAVNAQHTETTDVPLMLTGGEHVIGPVLPRLCENLCVHYG